MFIHTFILLTTGFIMGYLTKSFIHNAKIRYILSELRERSILLGKEILSSMDNPEKNIDIRMKLEKIRGELEALEKIR
jgi:hypothetical protein